MSPDPELTPRKPIVSVGYSFKAEQADTAHYVTAAGIAAFADSSRIAGESNHAIHADSSIYADSAAHSTWADTSYYTLSGVGSAWVTAGNILHPVGAYGLSMRSGVIS